MIASFITPYESDRIMLRQVLAKCFVEVYVKTPLDICRQRDPKGLYAKADAGLIKQFTGVSAPFEQPVQPEITLCTTSATALECARSVMAHIDESIAYSVSL